MPPKPEKPAVIEEKKIEKKEEPKEQKTDLSNEALKIAKLVDQKNTAETAKLLVDSMKKVKNKKNNLKQNLKEPSKKIDHELKSLLSKPYPEELAPVSGKQESSEVLKIDEASKEEKDPRKKKASTFFSGSPYQITQSLKGGAGLSLFSELKQTAETKESVLWSMHYDQELKLAQEIPPINGFDEMIQLTNEGKLWKFPIDNEQDIDEVDAQTPFHEHVFLDHYLEEFPKIEPIQQFMTLALNGLSQNSYLSINEKKEIIDWYKNYFTEKLDIIKEALEAERLEASFRESIEQKAP